MSSEDFIKKNIYCLNIKELKMICQELNIDINIIHNNITH